MTIRSHRRHRALGIGFAIAALLGSMTACSGVDRPHSPGATVIVVGNRANMPAPSLVPEARGLLDAAVRSQDTIWVVGVSGTPAVTGPVLTKSTCDSDAACAPSWRRSMSAVSHLVANAKATVPGADLLSAITLAGRQLAQTSGPKHIMVIDSGLQTTGDLPLQGDGALDVDPATLVASLKRNGSLPDLSGTDVLLTGLGSTSAPQPSVPEGYRKRLNTLWEKVITASSGHVSIDDAALRTAAPAGNLPSVPVVKFPAASGPGSDVCDVRVRADQIGFVADQATLTNEARAVGTLRPIAQRITREHASVQLIGTTAIPETAPNSPNRLSRQRALVVRRILVERLGVPADRIDAVEGVGTNFGGFVKDTDKQGHLIEAVAIGNRLVIMKLATKLCPPNR